MNDRQQSRHLVVAGDFHEFRSYCQEQGFAKSGPAMYVADEFSLRGMGRDTRVVFLEGAADRRDFNQVLAAVIAIRGTDEGLPHPIHEMGDSVGLGDKFRVAGTVFTLTDIDTDGDGCQQWTMTRRGGRCDRMPELTTRHEGQSTNFAMPGEIMNVPPLGQEPTGMGPFATPPPARPVPPAQPSYDKCAFRAPELGPHPDCPNHNPGPHPTPGE